MQLKVWTIVRGNIVESPTGSIDKRFTDKIAYILSIDPVGNSTILPCSISTCIQFLSNLAFVFYHLFDVNAIVCC